MILVVSVQNDPSATDDEAAALLSDIAEICPEEIELSTRIEPAANRHDITRKGDPITLGAIVLASVASGGVMAKALAPGGFLTKLADIVRERIRKDVKLSIEAADGSKIELTGSSKEIESLLKKHFQRDRRG